MKVKQLFTEEDAVSPVIGVILMVAITVILAAVIGAFVLNIGGSQDTAPSVSFDFENEYADDTRVTVTSASQEVPTDNWGIDGDYSNTPILSNSSKVPLASGNSFVVDSRSFSVTWRSPSTDKTAVLGTYEV